MCDREADCDDGSDELNCPEMGCLANQFRCNSSECIPVTWRCDLTPDCSDGSDESAEACGMFSFSGLSTHKIISLFLGKTVCRASDFRCNSTGRCIPATWVCDGEDDCSDKSDEQSGVCAPYQESCIPDDFQCRNGRCINQVNSSLFSFEKIKMPFCY